MSVIPVGQQRVHHEQGDCFAACFASIFEVPLESVLDLYGAASWVQKEDRMALANLGLALTPISWDAPRGYAILSVKSALFPGKTHAVVAKEGRVVWDPSPDPRSHRTDEEYQRDATHYYVFYALDPAQPINLGAIL